MRVKVNRDNLTIQARRGYFAPKSESETSLTLTLLLSVRPHRSSGIDWAGTFEVANRIFFSAAIRSKDESRKQVKRVVVASVAAASVVVRRAPVEAGVCGVLHSEIDVLLGPH